MFARALKNKLYRPITNLLRPDRFANVTGASPLLGVPGHNPRVQTPRDVEIQISELSNGVTVVSHSQEMPGAIDLQVVLNVGTRDETHKTSGSLLSIKNTYYKTVLITNEAVNYGMVQMTGGNFTMNYDQETTQFNASCLAHDVYDILSMTCDCALEPRSAVAAGVGIRANKDSLALEQSVGTGIDFNDLLFRTAYGLKGLGMPILGLASNVEYLNAHTLQAFQMENFTPNRIFVGATNVENHDELVELVGEKLSIIPAMGETGTFKRSEDNYQGGEHRNETTSNRADIAIVYPTQGWTGANYTAYQIAAEIIGNFDSFSLIHHADAQFSRAHTQVGRTHSYVDVASAINSTFENSGLFGIRVSGASTEAQNLFDIAKDQLAGLATSVTEAELEAAKSTLKIRVLRGLERPADRLSESLRNLKTFGKIVHTDYISQINAVTASDVQEAIGAILRQTPTVIAQGGQVARIRTNF